MLVQLHQRDNEGKCEFVAQNEFAEDMGQQRFGESLEEWFQDVKSRHLLLEGCHWFMCDQDTPEFMWAA